MSLRIPEAKAAILAELAQRPALAEVHRQWGLPAKLPDTRERIYVSSSEDFRRSSEGSLTVEEFLIRLVIEVHRPGTDSAQSAEERMWVLAAEVEALVPQHSYSRSWESEPETLDAYTDGWIVRVRPAIGFRVVT